jgi:hypothetical protein
MTNTREVRQWAQQHGIPVKSRGRLPKRVHSRYKLRSEEKYEYVNMGNGIVIAIPARTLSEIVKAYFIRNNF